MIRCDICQMEIASPSDVYLVGHIGLANAKHACLKCERTIRVRSDHLTEQATELIRETIRGYVEALRTGAKGDR